jgi:hypothetical protein
VSSTGWRDWVAVPDWRFWENQGAGIAVADLDGDGVAELVVLAVDNTQGQNGGYYSVGWGLDERGRPADGWGPWQPVPDWRFWENQDAALAIAALGRAPRRTWWCWRSTTHPAPTRAGIGCWTR